jgi:phosphate transport system permease protein
MTNLAKRKKAELRFRFYGIFSVFLSLLFVAILIFNICSSGIGGFYKTIFLTSIHFDQKLLNLEDNASEEQIRNASFRKLIKNNFDETFKDYSKDEIKQIEKLFYRKIDIELKNFLISNPEFLNKTTKVELTASTHIDQIHKGNFDRTVQEKHRKVNNFQLEIYDKFVEDQKVKKVWNSTYFTTGDSRDPESAGVAGSVMGSVFTILICFLLSFPIAIFASIYLQEFAKTGKITDLIEININNLAAVPSIIFGLLGLGILLNFFGLPRSTALVGGIVLSFMTLPTIIVACRSSLRAVPPSIREAALALGATKNQVVFHHVLPLAMPGTLTGAIIGLARAIGETAPLLMIGMVAFIMDIPSNPLEPAVGMPAQIYLWSESSERGFIEKTSSAIILLLIFLIVVNFVSVYFRKKYEKKW